MPFTQKQLWLRLNQSAVVWFWLFNGFRFASGVLLLPLLLHSLSRTELGMYYVFLGLTGLLPVVDIAFSLNISRYTSYAMGGAIRLQAQGIDYSENKGGVNYELLGQLLEASRVLYRYLAAVILIALGCIGALMVAIRVQETPDPTYTWLAWGLTIVAATIEVYSGWWNAFLRGMDQVLTSARVSVATYALRTVVAGALLIAGAGLLAIPTAALLSAGLNRYLSRRCCLKLLAQGQRTHPRADLPALLRLLWPNSWRVGLQLLRSYLCLNWMAFLCLKSFGLNINAQFGLSLQILTIIQGMSAVWTSVAWPRVGQLMANRKTAEVQQILASRVQLQNLTFVTLSALALASLPTLLNLWGTNKQFLPSGLWTMMALNTFLEMQFSIWTVLLSLENRIPSLWATVTTNALAAVVAYILVHSSSFGVAALVIAPLASGCLFNYWYWPRRGARTLESSWIRMTLARPTLN